MSVIDGHAHLSPGKDSLNKLLSTMDECGITHSIVVAGGLLSPEILSTNLAMGGGFNVDANNEEVLQRCIESKGRLIPFYFGNPYNRPDEYRYASSVFKGLKLAPGVHGIPFNDERMIDWITAAEEKRHPVYLHCLSIPGFRVPEFVSMAKKFPNILWILGHAGVGNLDLYGIQQIRPYENIFFETSGGFSYVLKYAIDQLGSQRVIFGSEYPLQHPLVELTKYKVLNLPDSVLENVTRNNICRVIGVDLA